MEKVLLNLTEIFGKIPNHIIRLRKQVLLVLFLISASLIYGVFNLTVFDMSTDSFLEEENPAQIALDEFRRQFGGDDSVFIIYSPKDGNVFSRASLTSVQELTDDLSNWAELDKNEYSEIDWNALEHVRRVQSIANVRVQESIGDTLKSERLIPRKLPTDEIGLQQLQKKALSQRDYVGAFYSEDSQFARDTCSNGLRNNPRRGIRTFGGHGWNRIIVRL